MTPTFKIDQDGITIRLTLDSQYEKAVAKMLQEFEVCSVNILEKEYHYHHSDPEMQYVEFRMIRKEPRNDRLT